MSESEKLTIHQQLRQWRTLEQEAARVQLHPATLRLAIRSGKLRCARVSGRRSVRLLPEWTDAYLLSGSTPVEATSAA